MRLRHLLALSALLALPAIGCSVSPPTSSAPRSALPSGPAHDGTVLNQADAPPAQSGIIVRGTTATGWTFVDENSGLRSIIGISAADFCAGIPDFSIVGIQQANLPNGVILLHGRGDMYAEVRPAGPFDCGAFTGDPIASGTVKLVYNDNDFYTSGTRTNSFGWSAEGTLYGADGAAYRFHQVVRIQIQNGVDSIRVLKVELTPIQG